MDSVFVGRRWVVSMQRELIPAPQPILRKTAFVLGCVDALGCRRPVSGTTGRWLRVLIVIGIGVFAHVRTGAGAPPVNRGDHEDVFAKAAKFVPEGPIPELPPLPPVEKRPLLVLDPMGHTAFIKHVFFTPDSSRVISISEDKMIRVWDNVLGEELYSVSLPAGSDVEGRPLGAALSPDGKRLAVGVVPLGLGKLGLPIYILDVETGELIEIIKDCPGIAKSIEYSKDGQWLLVGAGTGALGVYDLQKRKWIMMFAKAHKSVHMARFSPLQSTIIASVGEEKIVKLWDMTKTEALAVISFEKQGPNCIDWLPNGSALGVGCSTGEMQLVSPVGKIMKFVPPKLVPNGAIQIVRMRFTPDGTKFVSGGVAAAGWAGITDIATGKQTTEVLDHLNTVMAVDVSKDGVFAASGGGENNEILVWSVETGEVIRRFQPLSQPIWAVGWSKDGKSIAFGKTNSRVRGGLCKIEQQFSLTDFLPSKLAKEDLYTQDLHRDGAISIKVDDFFHFTVSENGKPQHQHTSRSNRIYSVSLLPGQGIVVGASHAMYLIDVKSGKLLQEFLGDNGLTTAVAPSPDAKYFVTGSTDQVIRIWSPAEKEPVLSLFTVGREWIAWTPRGYYACSAIGERLIGWQVNDGIDKLPAIHPAAMFHASLYQPKMLRYLIPSGNLARALAMANKFEREQITVTELAAALPPNVSITAPTTTDDKPFVVRATAEGSDKKPILSMRLLVDGRTFEGDAGVREFDNKAKADANWQLSLEPGIHTITVLAESPLSKGQSKVIRVKREGAAAKSNLYVVAAGISRYPGAMKLQYAASDAANFTRALEEKSKPLFTNIEMKILVDQKATLKNIRQGLDWLKQKMTPSDVGIVYFSGHGGLDEDEDQFYLIPVDVGRSFKTTCLAGEELKKRLENMPGKLIAILDACHSGNIADSPDTVPVAVSRPDNLVRDLLSDECGIMVLASSLGSEVSMESVKTKSGYYTYALIEGMAKAGDLNHDGFIYVGELSTYASLRVQELSLGTQNPTLGRPPQLRPFPIAKP